VNRAMMKLHYFLLATRKTITQMVQVTKHWCLQ